MSIKALGQQSLIYGMGHIMARLITFLLLPLYTNAFNQEEYGALSLAYAFIGFALILYRYGMDTALMKYSVQTDGQERIKHITVIIVSQICTGILFTFALYLLRDGLAIWVLGINKPDWMVYLSIILLLDSLWALPLLILRSEERAIPYIVFSLINVITTMLLNIIFVIHCGYGIEGVFKANILASGIVFLLSLPIIIKRIDLRILDKKTFIKILSFGLPFLPAGIFTMVMELSDRYLLEWFLGTSEVGLYSAGKKMGMLGLTVVMGFNMGWTPYFLKRGKETGARIEFAKVTTLFLGIMGYLLILVSLWITDIMQFSIAGQPLIGHQFWDCKPVVPIILLGYFFFGTYVLQLPGVYIKEITKWVPIFRIVGASTLIISSIFLIPFVGFVGAAYGVVLAYFSMSAAIYFKTYRIYPTPYNWRGFITPLIFLLGIQFGIESIYSKIAIIIFYPFIWYGFTLNKNEKVSLVRLIK